MMDPTIKKLDNLKRHQMHAKNYHYAIKKLGYIDVTNFICTSMLSMMRLNFPSI